VPDDERTRTFFLGLRLSDGGSGEAPPTSRRWSGTVYDQMVPQIDTRFRGLDSLPERVLDVIDRVRIGERRFFVPGADALEALEAPPPEDEHD